MKQILPNGVSKDSTSFFSTPPENILPFLYYPLCMGHYTCTQPYEIQRDNYDSFLLIYTESGTGMINVDGIEEKLTENTVCILDCYKPHAYYAVKNWDFLWLHFDGKCVRSFYDYLRKEKPFFTHKLDNPLHFKRAIMNVYQQIQTPAIENELILSQNIAQLLTILGTDTRKKRPSDNSDSFLGNTLKFIQEHISQEITLEILSKNAALSPFYFSRKFKKLTGYTPYRYILISRICLAKFYLKSTADSVKNIGLNCGFQSEHSFCTTFKKELGMTPSEYRQSVSKDNT